jgi:hypothetical protein
MAGDPGWEAVWRAAGETDRSGTLLLVAVAIALVLGLVAAAVWARWGVARRPAPTPVERAVADPLTPLSS